MANLAETSTWEPGIYQLEEEDLVKGGPDGIDNTQAKQLANRTTYLKALVEALGTGKQPLDATLTAIAGLVGAADKLAYFNGADTAALTTLTAFARTLLDDADAVTMRTTLGLGAASLLAVGTAAGTVAAGDHAHAGYQPSDATLTAIAGLVGAADKLAYFNGADTAALTTLTAFARTLLDDADAATMRTTLGLGDLSTKNVATDFACLLSINGYLKLPNGLIIQWGSGTVSSNTTQSTTFPLAFPTSVFGVVGSIGGSSSGLQTLGFVPTASLSVFNIVNFNAAAVPYCYVAFGR